MITIYYYCVEMTPEDEKFVAGALKELAQHLEEEPIKLPGRVEGWRGKSVSSPRLVKRSMRFSRTTLTYTLPTKVYVTYRTGVAFTFDDSGLRT